MAVSPLLLERPTLRGKPGRRRSVRREAVGRSLVYTCFSNEAVGGVLRMARRGFPQEEDAEQEVRARRGLAVGQPVLLEARVAQERSVMDEELVQQRVRVGAPAPEDPEEDPEVPPDPDDRVEGVREHVAGHVVPDPVVEGVVRARPPSRSGKQTTRRGSRTGKTEREREHEGNEDEEEEQRERDELTGPEGSAGLEELVVVPVLVELVAEDSEEEEGDVEEGEVEQSGLEGPPSRTREPSIGLESTSSKEASMSAATAGAEAALPISR